MKLANATKEPIFLPTGHKVPAGSTGTPITDATLHHPDNREFLSGEIRAARLAYVQDDEVKAVEEPGARISRERICDMTREQVIAELKARDLRAVGNTDDLRVRLAEHIFPPVKGVYDGDL